MTSGMRPGQLTPNDLELAILEHLASKESSISGSVQQLRVLNREFTGVGSFTTFICEESGANTPERYVTLDALINVPGVPNGMGAVLFFEEGKPECLEIFTYGDDWDGVFDGFSIEQSPPEEQPRTGNLKEPSTILSESHLNAPSEDLERRRPIWEALSDLFLDTEIDDKWLRHIAQRLADSDYTIDELKAIFFLEVFPNCYRNLLTPAGKWTGFDVDWLQEQILSDVKQCVEPYFPFDAGIVEPEWRKVLNLLDYYRSCHTAL
jgi:hypothetical protein